MRSVEKHWSGADHLVWRGTDHVLKYLLNIRSSNGFKMPSIQFILEQLSSVNIISSLKKENEVSKRFA